jgi:hypothetical protein
MALLTTRTLSETVIAQFVNGGLNFGGGVQLSDAMTLHKQLQMDAKAFQLLAAHLKDLLGEDFADVESGLPQTIDDLKEIIIDALVRKRDEKDLKRPCAQCGKGRERARSVTTQSTLQARHQRHPSGVVAARQSHTAIKSASSRTGSNTSVCARSPTRRPTWAH